MEDIRIRKNKALIKKALVTHYTNGLQDVTVSKLCQLSGVSRTAFYSYYPGIYSIIEELRLEFLPYVAGQPNTELLFVKERIEFVLQHKQEHLFLLSDGVCRDLFNDTVTSIVIDMLRAKDATLPKEVYKTIASFASPGIVGFFEHTLKSKQAFTVEQVLTMYKLIEKHLYHMFAEYTTTL